MVGIGGAVGAFMVVSLTELQDYSFFVISGVIIAGCLGWARLQLNAHRPLEIYSGFLLGIFCQLIASYVS